MKLLLTILAALTSNIAIAEIHQKVSGHDADRSHYIAPKAITPPTVDGVADEADWESAGWRPIDNIWLGGPLDPADFSGRYKVVWTEEKIYLLVEFVDDVLVDFHRDPLVQYWDDDCLEIFIDEDHSGGNHQYNHNAFAYHLSLDNQAIDIGTDRKARTYNHHLDSQWRQNGDKVTWEVAMDIYTDQYRDDSNDNSPISLSKGKQLGFMLAYCDNDHSELREHFVGSEYAAGDQKDRGWIDANLFGTLELGE
jgi:cellulose/xylan binding protein with CBM9 domain